jgi:N-methylhydantoinase B
VGAETALKIHDAPEGKIKGVAMGVAGFRNSGEGLFGGYPGAPAMLGLIEGTRVEEFLSQNRPPVKIPDLGGRMRMLPYCEFELKKSDVFYMRVQNGGGYGDPLERDPDAVRKDVINELVSLEAASEVYGVVVDGERLEVNEPATESLRARLREARLSGKP